MTPPRSQEDRKLFGIPMGLFKNPAATLLIGVLVGSGAWFGMSSPLKGSQNPAGLAEDVRRLQDADLVKTEKMNAMAERLERIEHKLDRLLDRRGGE